MARRRRPAARRSPDPHAHEGHSHGHDHLHEWVGGCLMTPFGVSDPTPRLVEMILWLELPHDLVVGCQLIDPEQLPVSFGKVLSATMRAPLAGPPRRPDRIRVASAKLAVEVRRVVPKIKVIVAPTPELERLVERMRGELASGQDGHSQPQ